MDGIKSLMLFNSMHLIDDNHIYFYSLEQLVESSRKLGSVLLDFISQCQVNIHILYLSK